MFRILSILAFLALSISGHTARAEGMASDAYTSTLLELNRTKPEQNPALSLGKDQLNARVLDKNRITIGKVEDIILMPDGKFQTIQTKLDITGFHEMAGFDVASYIIDPTPDTFTVSMDKSQISQNLPQLLTDVAPAGGTEGPVTVNGLRNARIYRPDGTTIAKVKDVLIDKRAAQVVALLVTTTAGNARGATIAIPYEAAQARMESNGADLVVTEEQASIILSMATRR